MHTLTDEDVDFARNVAAKTARRHWQYSPFYDDLVSAGLEIAVRCARDYDDPRPFKSYLSVRVAGAVYDEARKLIYSRSMRDRGTKVPLSLEAFTMPQNSNDQVPYQFTDWQVEVADKVADAMLLSYLLNEVGNDRDRFIVRERVIRGRSQGDVAADLGISPSRVCQIEGVVYPRLRSKALA